MAGFRVSGPCFEVAVYILYMDEFGHAGAYDPLDPRHAQHPLFGLAGVLVAGQVWKELDRSFLRLKTEFYKSEIARKRVLEGVRPERFEPKQLRKSSRRDRRFAYAVLDAIRHHGAHVVALGQEKRQGVEGFKERALYNSTVQAVLRTYERWLRGRARHKGRGILILDRRSEHQNQLVLESAQSYLFAAPSLPWSFERVVETPLLVPSEWYHGIQLADVVGRVVGLVHRHRVLGDPGYSWADEQFGTLLDELTAIDATGRSSVHVRAARRRAATPAPSKASAPEAEPSAPSPAPDPGNGPAA